MKQLEDWLINGIPTTGVVCRRHNFIDAKKSMTYKRLLHRKFYEINIHSLQPNDTRTNTDKMETSFFVRKLREESSPERKTFLWHTKLFAVR